MTPFHAAVAPARERSQSSPLLVLLHGYGSHEHDLLALAEELDPIWTVVCPRAPMPMAMGGNAWFTLRVVNGRIDGAPQEAINARDQVAAWLDGLRAQLEIGDGPTVLGGFSQGAMLAAAVLLERPDLANAGWLMSGAFPPAACAAPRSMERLPILVQHGTQDAVVPVGMGRALAEGLRQAGAEVTYQEYSMQHQVSMESLQDAQGWLRALVATDS